MEGNFGFWGQDFAIYATRGPRRMNQPVEWNVRSVFEHFFYLSPGIFKTLPGSYWVFQTDDCFNIQLWLLTFLNWKAWEFSAETSAIILIQALVMLNDEHLEFERSQAKWEELWYLKHMRRKKTSSPATAMVGDDCTELRFPSSS